MANYTINYKCGHSAQKELYGKLEERYKKIEWLQENCLCPECSAKEKARENEAALARLKMAGLEVTEGSEKQIPWASSIKARYLDAVERIKATDVSEQVMARLQEYARNSEAEWWIDNRRDLADEESILEFARLEIRQANDPDY